MQVREQKDPDIVTVGLFGTCGGSKWRDAFKRTYDALRIHYFDPQVDDWKPEDADIEADHLADDEIILFPLTSETYAFGSLAETGFSILQAIRLDDRRDFVIMIAQTLDDTLADENMCKESLRARALVKRHLAKLRLSNVFLVDDLDQMLELSVTLHTAAVLKKPLLKYNAHWR